MVLNFLGCGSAFNPGLGNTSAYFVAEHSLFLMDAGESVFKKLFEQGLLTEYNEIFILITHAHADHVGSLASIISYTYFVLGKRVTVIHPNNTISGLLERLGICREAYGYVEEPEISAKGVTIQAIPVKHAENMECFGYLIQNRDERIFYSGDSYEIPPYIEEEFLNGRIQSIYQDTTEFETASPSHCPLKTLEERIPAERRNQIYCMHFTNDFTEKISEKGFRFVEVSGREKEVCMVSGRVNEGT